MEVAKAALIAVCLAFLGSVFSGCSFKNYGDELFELRRAASGKDVMWLPTKTEMAQAMLEAADVGPADIVYDLGSGDGVLAIQAAKIFGARAVGIEFNPDLVALSERNAVRARVEHLVSFRRGDIFSEDFSEATVLTLYLGEELNNRLMPKLLRMPAGTRIVSNTFRMEAWTPDKEIRSPNGDVAYLWVTPALLDGQWAFKGFGDTSDLRLTIRQKKQFFDGFIETPNQRRIVFDSGKISSSQFQFDYLDASGRIRTFVGVLKDDKIIATLSQTPEKKFIGYKIK